MFHVLIAEEDATVRAELQRAIEAVAESAGQECVVSMTEEGVTTFRKAKRVQPNLVLISSTLPLGGGVQIVLALQLYAPHARIVVLANRGEDTETLLMFVHAGAHGIVAKHQPAASLVQVIGRVMRGERYYVAERPVAFR
jgi:DNA-binding NarL/FixJ family response regulator